MRHAAGRRSGGGLGAVFLSVNRNKRSIALDLKTDEGRALAHTWPSARGHRDRKLRHRCRRTAWHRCADAAAAQRPPIHCSISGFGRSGPLRNSPGYDVILQAFSGMMSLTGDEDGGYIRSPISPIDQMTGTHAFNGILAALSGAGKNGQGRHDQGFAVRNRDRPVALQSSELLGARRAAAEMRLEPRGALPLSGFRGRRWPDHDRRCQRQSVAQILRVAGLEHIVDDPKFRTNADRVAHRAETLGHVQTALAKHRRSSGTRSSHGSACPARRSIRSRSCSTILTPRQPESSSTTCILCGTDKGVAQPF